MFSELSQTLSKEISKSDKKKDGIYFTPSNYIKQLYNIIKSHLPNKDDLLVLEPSCGSCEMIDYLLKQKDDSKKFKIKGIELNDTIFKKINELKKSEYKNIELVHGDFLRHNYDIVNNDDEDDNEEYDNDIDEIEKGKYDLIIGNPPFFVMKNDIFNTKYKNIRSYRKYFNGRPNICILFLIKCLNLLNIGGVLGLVLPKNFINCLYYDKVRKHIKDNFKIIDIVHCENNNFIDTQQDTILMVVKKISNTNTLNNDNKKYILSGCSSSFTIFNTVDNIVKLNSLYANSKTMKDLNLNISVGNVVWNQCKKLLTDDKKNTRLIYNSDIKENKLSKSKFSNSDKKHFIKGKKGSTDIILVLNRGYGNGAYNFNYCLIDEKDPYLIENHLICINSIVKNKQIKNCKDKQEKENKCKSLKDQYKKIIKSLKDDKTKQFISLYFGNNAVNTTELLNILPIYGL